MATGREALPGLALQNLGARSGPGLRRPHSPCGSESG